MIYNCKNVLKYIKDQSAQRVYKMAKKPVVAVVQFGDDEPSKRYVRNKLRDFDDVGIDWAWIPVCRNRTVSSLSSLLENLSNDPKITGIIVQRPILLEDETPENANKIVKSIMPPEKDIDGVLDNSPFLTPCVRGLEILLNEWNYDPNGKLAVVIGKGDVGQPVSKFLLQRGATVTICHSKTTLPVLLESMSMADIIVGAAGLKIPISPTHERKGQIIVDYGIRKDETGKLHGDICDEYGVCCKYKTPVPGGMGLMVRAGLILNILDAHNKQIKEIGYENT